MDEADDEVFELPTDTQVPEFRWSGISFGSCRPSRAAPDPKYIPRVDDARGNQADWERAHEERIRKYERDLYPRWKIEEQSGRGNQRGNCF